MFRKLFAGFSLNQMASSNAGANSVDLIVDDVCIALWPVANAPTEANLDSNSIVTVADLETATGGAIHDDTNAFADIIPRSIQARTLLKAAPPFTVEILNAAAGAPMDFLLMRRIGANPSFGGPLIGYYPAGVNPDGSTPIPIDLSAGILRYGEV